MTYRDEFPDFDPATMPALDASEWRDISWHNDACPQLVSARAGLSLWIDYADPAARNPMCELLCRFVAYDSKPDGEFYNDEPLIETDDWTEMLAFIASRATAGRDRIVSDAFNGAVRAIQEALGSDSGDFAGLWFCGPNEDRILATLTGYFDAQEKWLAQ